MSRAGALAIALVLLAGNARAEPVTRNEQDEDYESVRVRGTVWSSPRGLGDTRVKRELLEASPRQQTSELLSAAPGFFVDHQDGEGLGNDVYLRGFDLEHGSGIEMRVGSVPVNVPNHIRGQGYADVNFVIPEVVRSIRVLEGPYDPRQGDAAVVGSAYLDLGVEERGYRLKGSFGSFNQARIVGIAAPRDGDPETFAAFSARHTDGFGVNRASLSTSANVQYGIDLGPSDHLRLLGTAYASRAELPGVVRQDDIDAGRIARDGTYPYFAQSQGVNSGRVVLAVDFDHITEGGAHFELAPYFTWTDLRARQNFDGALESSQQDPTRAGLGDLWQTANRESAAGLTSRFRPVPLRIGFLELAVEPGVVLRLGHTAQSKYLLVPSTLEPWDRRIDARLGTLDLGGYVDVDLKLFRRLRISGGPRADLLSQSIRDVLTSRDRSATGVVAGPRVSVEYTVAPWISPVLSYGEGFRSLAAERLADGSTHPYSKVRSVEGGVHMTLLDRRYDATLALFNTWVENELVFEAESGGLETQRASTRKGLVASIVAKPRPWLLVSSALSLTRARYDTNIAGVSHFVPNVPPILWRVDASAHGPLRKLAGHDVIGRMGVGYTFLSSRRLSDTVTGPSNSVLNASAGLRWRCLELGVDVYNALGLRYADEASIYASNWSFQPGQQLASVARHVTAAPPRTAVGSLAVSF